jgi:hypothetical protein
MGFDLNGAWVPSVLHTLDFTDALSSQSTTEPQARTKRRSIQVNSRTISQMNASLIRAVNRCPFPTWSNMTPRRSHANSRPLARVQSYPVVAHVVYYDVNIQY